MMRFSQSLRGVAVGMAIVMLATSLPVNFARAAMVGTDQVVAAQAAADDRARVMQFMAREDVRRQLQALGVDPDEAVQRTVSLSDDEIRQISGKIDQLPAGQGPVGILVGAILIVLLVLLITDLVGATDVYPFVKK